MRQCCTLGQQADKQRQRTHDELVYILSSYGSGESLLSVYRPGDEYGLEAQVEIPGNPLDLSVSEGGEVYVLSCR
ncbi:MAG TPA: hypothetical protein P5207_09060 [Candidatus Sabulitectum sp.]|nr:hypothetical protein [Candidatus Sabulitectum sp.]